MNPQGGLHPKMVFYVKHFMDLRGRLNNSAYNELPSIITAQTSIKTKIVVYGNVLKLTEAMVLKIT